MGGQGGATAARAEAGRAAGRPRAGVHVRGDALEVDGLRVLPWGAEVQYFRVRDRGFDAARTHAIWAETLDRLVEAGMNHCSTYVPWDYHERREGSLDWAGARNLPLFLELAAERRLLVHLKPGPLMTGEWPRGMRCFGAVPTWWKQKHEEALARGPDGRPFVYSPLGPLGAADQVQPSFLHPAFLEAVASWYEAVAAVALPFVARRTVVLWQLDNETNFYWSDRYALDYSAVALEFWRRFALAQAGGSLDALGDRYAPTVPRARRLEDLAPPRAPLPSKASDGEEAWHRDWFAAGDALVADYLLRLRRLWEGLGVREPDVLFTANDTLNGFLGRQIQLPDLAAKSRVALATLDVYPRRWPWTAALLDAPFEADLGVKRIDRANDVTVGPSRFAYAAEVQGGLFELPFGIETRVRPEATEHLLLKLLARGARGASLYVARSGWNLDGTPYDFQAMLGPGGERRPRYDVVARLGRRLVGPHADLLLAARPVESGIAVAVDPRLRHPCRARLARGDGLVWSDPAGLFGWAAAAGYDPRVVELDERLDEELAPVRLVVLVAPGPLAEGPREALARHLARGGHVASLLAPGGLARGIEVAGGARGYAAWPVRARFGSGEIALSGEVRFLTGGEPFLAEARGAGAQARTIGAREGGLTVIGALPSAPFASGDYYAMTAVERSAAAALFRSLAEAAGEPPLVAFEPEPLEVALRAGPSGAALAFVLSASRTPVRARVRILDLARAGLDPGARLAARDLLADRPLGALAGGAFDLPLARHGAAVVRVAPEAPR